MKLDLMKTLKRIEKNINFKGKTDVEKLKVAYEETLRLRSQLIAVIYDKEHFIHIPCHIFNPDFFTCEQIEKKKSVNLTINEPLPSTKELTEAVEEHWIKMIHDEFVREGKTGIPVFDKAFVMIEITTPRGTHNCKVWDTSNRSINVIINNLKGILFMDDNFEHMAFGVTASWGEEAKTVIKIIDFDEQFKTNLDNLLATP